MMNISDINLRRTFSIMVVLFLFVLKIPVYGEATGRVSLNSLGNEGDNNSYTPSLSADGRNVAYYSSSTNLVDSDTNKAADIFVRDRQTGITGRVSVNSAGIEGDKDSYNPSISANGRYVAFYSYATNLVDSDTNRTSDIFVHDRQTGVTTRVSVNSAGVEGNNHSYYPSINAEGRYVAFESTSTNLVANDLNTVRDVFVHDRNTGITTRVSIDSTGIEGNDHSYSPSMSGDGRYIAFDSSSTNLVANDLNKVRDVFVHDRNTGITTRVSINSAGVEGDSGSYDPSISTTDRSVAFVSLAGNLVANDNNNVRDIFVHSMDTGVTMRVSINSAGIEGVSSSFDPAISAYGRYVAFESKSSNLTAGDTNNAYDVFTHDRLRCFGLIPTIIGTNGNDHIIGTNGPDVIIGLLGNDIIDGLGGNDIICGWGGDDILNGDDGDDIIWGGNGNDTINGGNGNDRLFGGNGNDTLNGGTGKDILKGGEGDDSLDGGTEKDNCDGGPHVIGDTGVNCEIIINIP